MREIRIKVFDKQEKSMSVGMEIPMLAGYLVAKYSDGKDLSDFIYLESTGLHDKNGKEIWEGDIIKVDFTKKEVKWVGQTHNGTGFNIGNGEHTVLGNIYENGDLLK